MDDAPKSQDVNQAAALRGEPEAAGQDRKWSDGDLVLWFMGHGWTVKRNPPWSALTDEANRERAWYCERDEAPFRTNASDVCRWYGPTAWKALENSVADLGREFPKIAKLANVWGATHQPPQAASGCSHTARSDDPTTWEQVVRSCIKDTATAELILSVPHDATAEEAHRILSAEQGATPPAPAALDLRAAKHCCAILGAACEHHTHREIREAWQALRSALAASPQPADRILWPKGRDVRRRSDMDPKSTLQITLDADNDVCVGLWGDHGYAGVEFCNAFSGGGKSPRTREALISVMLAMEEDAVPAAEGGAS